MKYEEFEKRVKKLKKEAEKLNREAKRSNFIVVVFSRLNKYKKIK